MKPLSHKNFRLTNEKSYANAILLVIAVLAICGINDTALAQSIPQLPASTSNASSIPIFTDNELPRISPVSPETESEPSQPARPSEDESRPLPNILEGGLNTIVSESYRLTNGDVISLWIANVPEYSTQFQILDDGTVNLPVIGHIPLWGLTLEEAAVRISNQYEDKQVLVEPVVSVILSSMNPLRISIIGEIKRPGSYVLTPMNGESPTLTRLIAEAGGITEKANLNNVHVYRLTPENRQKVITVSLWDLLMSGDLSQDLPLRDGDIIALNESTDIDFSTAQRIATASFSSEVISVNIMGEVKSPGLVSIPSDTTLNEILILAGGFSERANKKKLVIFRLNPDGSISNREVKIDPEAPLNEETNPLMHHRDILVIGKSTGSSARDLVTSVRDIWRTVINSPIDGVLSIFDLLF